MLDSDIKGKIPQEVISVVKAIKRHHHMVYLVGGSVRDIILGRDVLDWDIATSAPPAFIMRIFKKSYPTGIKHGTVTVIFKRRKFEITTFRSESDYKDGRHPDNIKFGVSIEEDLLRRDFTINAIAYDPVEGIFIDPFNGLRDIDRRLIKCVNNAYDRLSEDGLRSLRAIRFATVLGYRLHNDIIPAISETIPVFLKVSIERIRDEILKMMSAKNPSRGILLMQKSGLLKHIFPELLPTIGFIQNRWHKYELFTHSLKTMDFLPASDPELRLMGLLHDIAKPLCKSGETEEATYYGHDLKGAEMVAEIFRRMKFPNRSVLRARLIITNHMIGYRSEWSDAAIRRLVKRLGREVHTILIFQRADVMARGREVKSSLKLIDELEERVYNIEQESSAINLNQLKVDGNDIMRIKKIPPSPQVGGILKRLMEMVIENPELNRRGKLLKLIKGL